MKTGRLFLRSRSPSIAKTIPLRTSDSATDSRMAQLEHGGLARVGTGKLPADFWQTSRKLDNDGAVSAALVAERKEGR